MPVPDYYNMIMLPHQQRMKEGGEVILDIIQAIEERHSVRAYTTQKIEEEKRQRRWI